MKLLFLDEGESSLNAKLRKTDRFISKDGGDLEIFLVQNVCKTVLVYFNMKDVEKNYIKVLNQENMAEIL